MRITFHPMTRSDFPRVGGWLGNPHVRTWWPEPDAETEFGAAVDGTEPTSAFLFHVDGEPVGVVQCYRHADHPGWDREVGVPAAVGIDYLVGESDRCGRGIGTAAITAFTELVLARYPDADAVVAVPQRDNRSSCRALEKAGYELLDERVLDSDDPSDAGVSAIYAVRR